MWYNKRARARMQANKREFKQALVTTEQNWYKKCFPLSFCQTKICPNCRRSLVLFSPLISAKIAYIVEKKRAASHLRNMCIIHLAVQNTSTIIFTLLYSSDYLQQQKYEFMVGILERMQTYAAEASTIRRNFKFIRMNSYNYFLECVCVNTHKWWSHMRA